MFHMNQNLKVVLAVEPVDLRKSFNGLYAIARCELGEVPEEGALFIFSNRTKTRIKVLCFDGTGCWVSVKRLEEGTFSWQRDRPRKRCRLSRKHWPYCSMESICAARSCARGTNADF